MMINPTVTIRMAGTGDLSSLLRLKADIFDNAVNPNLAREYLSDPRHHMSIALVEGEIVGMASAVHYIHPDKKPELFINEAGVDGDYRGQGIGRKLIQKLCEHGKALGCASAWVLTEPDNIAAQKAYAAAGGVPAKEPSVMFEFDLD